MQPQTDFGGKAKSKSMNLSNAEYPIDLIISFVNQPSFLLQKIQTTLFVENSLSNHIFWRIIYRIINKNTKNTHMRKRNFAFKIDNVRVG